MRIPTEGHAGTVKLVWLKIGFILAGMAACAFAFWTWDANIFGGANLRALFLFWFCRLWREAYLAWKYPDPEDRQAMEEEAVKARLQGSSAAFAQKHYWTAAFRLMTWGQKCAVVIGILTLIGLMWGHQHYYDIDE